MINVFLFVLTVSLFDSFSTAQQIVIFLLILTTVNPVKNALSYLSGLVAAYFVCGLFGYLALAQLNTFISNYVTFKSHMSESTYYQTQMLAGIIFAVIGVLYFRHKKKSTKPEIENVIISRFNDMNGWGACLIGVIISVTGFPFSLPYIAVLEKFASMKMSMANVVGGVALYNLFYAFPMIAIFVVYIFAGAAGKENIETRLQEKARKLNINITTTLFILLGMISVVNAIAYFITGHAVFKNTYF